MLDVWVSGYSRAVQFVFVVVYTTVDPLLGDDSNLKPQLPGCQCRAYGSDSSLASAG